MIDGIAMVELLLGLPGMRVLGVVEGDDELVVTVETTAERDWCPVCGARAQAQDRSTRAVRDLSCFGRPVRLEMHRRRWRCRQRACTAKTWTEEVQALDATAVLTRRAGAEACHQVGQRARPVAAVAREFGVCWWTVMNAVIEHGTPLADDSGRVGPVEKLGVDESSFQASRPGRATRYVIGLVDLGGRRMIDLVPGNTLVTCVDGAPTPIPTGWQGSQCWPPIWPSRTATDCRRISITPPASLTPSTSYGRPIVVSTRSAAGCRTNSSATAAANTIPSIGSANCSSRAANASSETAPSDCCWACAPGDPNNEVLGAWLAKESVRDALDADNPADAEVLFDKTITGCDADPVAEIRALGKTLQRWRTEILAHHHTQASNGPTEGLNLLVKEVKRCGRGFENYRLRVLLRAGRPTWPQRPSPPILRTPRPHAHA